MVNFINFWLPGLIVICRTPDFLFASISTALKKTASDGFVDLMIYCG